MSTGIEWTDETWNPVRGCSRVSDECTNCYAEGIAARFSGEGLAYHQLARRRSNGEPQWTGEVRFVVEHLLDPIRWRKPRRIFVNSMSDLFHEKLADDQIASVFAVMVIASQHTYQVLTKRPARMQALLSSDAFRDLVLERVEDFWPEMWEDNGELLRHVVSGIADGATWPRSNIWLGVSVGRQIAAVERIPLLLQTPAAVRFLSCEPLLEAVSLAKWLPAGCAEWQCQGCGGFLGALGTFTPCTHCGAPSTYRCGSHVGNKDAPGTFTGSVNRQPIDWVIAGGESGSKARPMHPDWARALRDQCVAAGVPFFFKQWGEYDAAEARVGKKRAGRLLDGREWSEFPAGAA